MADLQQFREKVTIYRKRQDDPDTGRPHTQQELAKAIGLSADELGHRLRGTGRSPLTRENVLTIVLSLAAWETLMWDEAVQLLTLMDYPLNTPDWQRELRRVLALPTQSVQYTSVISADTLGDRPLLSSLAETNNQELEDSPPIFVPYDLPDGFIQRPFEYKLLKQSLLKGHNERKKLAITCLYGIGGGGKTALALAACYDGEIIEAFPDGIYWVVLGEEPGNLTGKVEELIYQINKERMSFTSTTSAMAWLRKLLENRSLLIILDDVWDVAHLKPFLQGGNNCARLVTTRNHNIIQSNIYSILVDVMHNEEAVELLCSGLDVSNFTSKEQNIIKSLTNDLSKWPLLLSLVNGVLYKRIKNYNQNIINALDYIKTTLDKKGITAFDIRNTEERSLAIENTLKISFSFLSQKERRLYQHLAIFPENVDIPFSILKRLWKMPEIDVEFFCQELYSQSLLLSFDIKKRCIRLHDLLVKYLKTKMRTQIVILHRNFLKSYNLDRWSDLSHNETYLWKYLAFHLVCAKLESEFINSVKDLRYISIKMFLYGTSYVEADLKIAKKIASKDDVVSLLNKELMRIGHLFTSAQTLQEIDNLLLNRLSHIKPMAIPCQALELEITHPFIKPWHPLPDLPSLELTRTLSGHTWPVWGCAISPQGNRIVSASADRTLIIWNVQTGEELLTLQGHKAEVYDCAIDPHGDWIVSASKDHTLKIWNLQKGEELLTLAGHQKGVRSCAISPHGDWIVSASEDHTLKVWDVQTGKERFTLVGHTHEVNYCAISPHGDWIVSASEDHTLKVWDAQTGKERFTLVGHNDGVWSCAISPHGDWVVSASRDYTLKIWDTQTKQEKLTLLGHKDEIRNCIINSHGDRIFSTSYDKTIKIWDAHTGNEINTFYGHTSWVQQCALDPHEKWMVSVSGDHTLRLWNIENLKTSAQQEDRVAIGKFAMSPLGDWLVSIPPGEGSDTTLRVWNTSIGKEVGILLGHKGEMTDCAVSPDGRWIVSVSEHRILKIWDSHTRKANATIIIADLGSSIVSNVLFDPQSKWIGFLTADKTFSRHDIKIGNFISSVTIKSDSLEKLMLEHCAISPRGDWIVSASADSTLKIWDAHTGNERNILRGHHNIVWSCAISPRGDWIVSASADSTLKIWDAHTGNERKTLYGHQGGVLCCAISPKGDQIVSVSVDNTLKIWEFNSGRCLTTFCAEGTLRHCVFHPNQDYLIAGGDGGLYFLKVIV